MRFIAIAAIAIAAISSPACAAQPSPDEMAWQVFVQMMAPVPGQKAVRYETWGSDADLYAAHPPHWPAAAEPKLLQRSVGGAASHPRAVTAMVAAPDSCKPPGQPIAGKFPADDCIGEEVRHNWPAFHYLASNDLVSTEGRLKAYANGLKVALPPDSVIAKADWVPVADILSWLKNAYRAASPYRTADDVRRAYYTAIASQNGKSREYALVGVSIQSKQLPDWLWMTFEHRSNPGRCDIIHCRDDFGAAMADVAPAPTADSDYGPCAKTPALRTMFAKAGLASVWNNYCLKGTQTYYLTPTLQPTLLGNSVVERINHGVPIPWISCITCHAYASFDKNGKSNNDVLSRTPVGAVNGFALEGFDGDDFVWGVMPEQ